MEIVRVLVLMLLLLGGGLVLASIEAFPHGLLGCDGRVNMLFASRQPNVLTSVTCYSGLLCGIVFAFLAHNKEGGLPFGRDFNTDSGSYNEETPLPLTSTRS